MTDLWEFAAREFEAALLRDAEAGPETIGEVDPDDPPTTSRELAAALTRDREHQRPHLDLIDRTLAKCMTQGRQRIIINIGPRYGKTRGVRWACLHRLMRQPDSRIIYGSYGKALAHEQTRWVRDQLESHDLGVTVRQDTRAADRWYIKGHDGGMLAAGIGSGITGFGADLLVVDDAIADDAQAQSPTWRETGWRWFTQTAFDRLEPNASVVIVMTRWHADDLAGRLLEQQPGVWTHIRVPTVAEDDDELGRESGELLWPERYDAAAVAEQKTTLGPHGFAARHQQDPAVVEGGMFKRTDWRYWEHFTDEYGKPMLRLEADRYALVNCSRFITMDLASSTKTSADWTVASAWAITPGGDLVLLDRLRARVTELDHAEFVKPLRQRWLQRYDEVYVEKMFATTTLAHALGRAGVPLVAVDPDTNKYTRAMPYARLVRQHRVWLPSDADWLGGPDGWLNEHALFTGQGDRHDDQVDTGSYASKIAVDHWLPPEDDHLANARRMRAAEAPSEIDFETAVW